MALKLLSFGFSGNNNILTDKTTLHFARYFSDETKESIGIVRRQV